MSCIVEFTIFVNLVGKLFKAMSISKNVASNMVFKIVPTPGLN